MSINVYFTRSKDINGLKWFERREAVDFHFNHESRKIRTVQMYDMIVPAPSDGERDSGARGMEFFAAGHQPPYRRIKEDRLAPVEFY